MNYEILNSGSDGNTIIINDFFMLDCGLSYKKIKDYINKVKVIFISHSHSDHFNSVTIKRIAYDKPTIKFVVGSTDLVDKLVKCGVRPSNIFALSSNKWFDLGMIKIRLEKLYHDVPNHLCKFEINNKFGIYIVDTNRVDNINAKNYDLFLIEANYMEHVLEQHKQEIDESGEYDHLYRVENTHLSYNQANAFLVENMGSNSTYEYIHRSKMNFLEGEM